MKATKLIKAYFGLPNGSAPSRRPVGAHRAPDEDVGDVESDADELAARRTESAGTNTAHSPHQN